jgi:phosphatidylinositol alpha-mannosyltransferase
MKIGFVATYDFAIPGGVKNHICNLAHELTEQGHEVSIIAPSSQSSITSKIPNFMQVAEFPSASKTGAIPPHILLGLRAIPRLQALLNDASFDLIHIHEPLVPPLCLSAIRYKKTPLFATFHTYYEHGQPLYRLFQPILNSWLKNLKGRIAVSVPAKRYIEQYFPYDYKIIPNGINLERFSTPRSAHPQINPDYFNLLFVGHAQFKRKGLRYMLEAYRILKPEFPKLRLLIAGTKWAGRNQPPELEDSDLQDIVYLGTVSDDELIELYKSADVFCAPSTGRESFGIVLIEAMAAGIPIVTTNINGYSTVATHEHDALMVPPKNGLAFAQAIKRMMQDPALRERLAHQGHTTVQRYSWKILATEIVAYYHQQLNSNV